MLSVKPTPLEVLSFELVKLRVERKHLLRRQEKLLQLIDLSPELASLREGVQATFSAILANLDSLIDDFRKLIVEMSNPHGITTQS